MNKASERNTLLTLVILTVVCCLVKFILDGVVVSIYGQTINFGHVDATVYLTLLSPILGSHSFIESKKLKAPQASNDKQS